MNKGSFIAGAFILHITMPVSQASREFGACLMIVMDIMEALCLLSLSVVRLRNLQILASLLFMPNPWPHGIYGILVLAIHL